MMLLLASYQAGASELIVPNTFSSGSRAVAADVNDNFIAVKESVNDNDSRLAVLEATILALQTNLAAANKQIDLLQTDLTTIQSNNALSLGDVITVGEDQNGFNTVFFNAVNLNINNGTGMTVGTNGLGNLIVGYNQKRISTKWMCSKGVAPNENECTNANGIWSTIHKSGSHNIIVGEYHNYSSYGGLVAGEQNSALAPYATVSGGKWNVASQQGSSVSGGFGNTAYSTFSSVSGGTRNVALNTKSSILGGGDNVTAGDNSSIVGGSENITTGFASTIGGGRDNSATGLRSTVSGGVGRDAPSGGNWVAGTLLEIF